MGCLAAVVVTGVIDARHAAPERLGARLYVASVFGYQAWARPVVRRFVVCRYSPSCSDYSLQAVRRFGLSTGLSLTVKRLLRCRPGVPGGADPVPERVAG